MKKVLIVIGIIVVVLVAIAVAIPFFINVNQFRPTIESQLTNALGRRVQIGGLSFSLLRGQLGASNITIADDPAFSSSPFVLAQALDISVEIMPLIFQRAVHVESLVLEQPQVALIRSASGTRNFSTIGQSTGTHPATKEPAPPSSSNKPATQPSSPAGSSMPEIQVQKLEIANGRILLGSTGHRPQAYDEINFRAQNVSYNSRFPFVLSANMPGGGKLQVQGQAGPVDRRDAARTPFEVQTNITRLD